MGEDGLELFKQFSSTWPDGDYDEKYTIKKWESFKPTGDDHDWDGFLLRRAGITGMAGSVRGIRMAKHYNDDQEEQADEQEQEQVAVETAPAFSEEALALLFAEQHADTLRYVAEWNQWLVWDGSCWRMD